MEEDPEQQCAFRRIYRPMALRPGKDVGGNEVNSCRFRIGDLIRPIYRLADLEAYGCGAVCQVVGLDDEGDPIVSCFDPDGNLSEDSSFRFVEHFEYVCTATILEEHPECQHSSLLRAMNTNY